MMYEITVPQFTNAMRNLKAILAKGAAYADSKKIEMSVLLNARLAPDQFPLVKQVQIATDAAKLCAVRLTGVPAPTHDDKETTLAELNARIDSVVEYLNSLQAKDFSGSETKQITQPRWEGKYLLGQDYVLQHAIPNVYFHVTTAYSILRHNGVDIGKKDYLGGLSFKS